MSGNEVVGKNVKAVWIDNNNSKVVFGKLISLENGIITIKTLSGQIFMINQSNLISLYEYRGELK